MADNDFYRDFSGRLSFEMLRVKAAAYGEMCKRVAERFGLDPAGQLIAGLDEVFQDYRRGDVTVGLEWDNWSGFIVVAKSPEAEPLVKDIAQYLLQSPSVEAQSR